MNQVVCVTGGAKRIGAAIVRYLHQHHYRVVIHAHESMAIAGQLADELNAQRPDSALALQADCCDVGACQQLIEQAACHWGRLDALVNNASTFFPSAIGDISERDWHALMDINLKAPLFLAQAALPHLRKQANAANAAEAGVSGIASVCSIINIIDTHGTRPLSGYSVYSASKAGLLMLTQALAKDCAPHVRVNAVAPGNILWPQTPDNALSEEQKQRILQANLLKRQGTVNEIAKAIQYLLEEATYTTGQVLMVDGGRSL